MSYETGYEIPGASQYEMEDEYLSGEHSFGAYSEFEDEYATPGYYEVGDFDTPSPRRFNPQGGTIPVGPFNTSLPACQAITFEFTDILGYLGMLRTALSTRNLNRIRKTQTTLNILVNGIVRRLNSGYGSQCTKQHLRWFLNRVRGLRWPRATDWPRAQSLTTPPMQQPATPQEIRTRIRQLAATRQGLINAIGRALKRP